MSAEDLGQSDTQQVLTFTLDSSLNNGDQVIIDLSDPQAKNQVDYTGANADDNTAGTASFTVQNNNAAEITYEADGSEAAGDTVTVTISGLDASGSQADGTYDVIFEGPGGDSMTTTFTVS